MMPPTTTSHLQPMDAGIINSFKVNYRRHLVRFHIDAIDEGRQPKVKISDAIRWTKLSWEAVTESCISNCWRHTGILPVDDSTEEVRSSVAATTETDHSLRDFGNIFERLRIPTELLMSPTEYINIDKELTTCEMMTDEEIIKFVSGEESDDDLEIQDREDATSTRITNGKANEAIDTLLRYFEQSDTTTSDDVERLCYIKRRISCLCSSSLKQSSIMDFFTHQ